jgi:hypothetical protein
MIRMMIINIKHITKRTKTQAKTVVVAMFPYDFIWYAVTLLSKEEDILRTHRKGFARQLGLLARNSTRTDMRSLLTGVRL